MSKDNVSTILLLAVAGVGGYLLLDKFGSFKKGIDEAVTNVTETVDKIYNNPVSDTSRTILDDAGILDKDNPVSTIASSGSLATNPINRLFDIFGAIGSKIVTGVKERAEDPAEAFKQEVKQMGTSTILNPVSSITNFFGGLFTGNKDTSTPIEEKRPTQDLSKYEVKNKALYDKILGEGNYEVIGAPLTKEAKEERKLNPVPTKSFEELAQQDNFMGRVAKYVLSKKS